MKYWPWWVYAILAFGFALAAGLPCAWYGHIASGVLAMYFGMNTGVEIVKFNILNRRRLSRLKTELLRTLRGVE